jgi:hypothetical protein
MAGRKLSKKTLDENEAMFIAFKAAPAPLAENDIDPMAEAFTTTSPLARWYRFGLAIQGRSGGQLVDLARDRETAVSMASSADGMSEAAKALREMADLLESAALRAKFALVEREDMFDVLAEAKAA